MRLKFKKKALIIFICIFAFFLIRLILLAPLFLIGEPNPNAGLWEDDPRNWNRAFHSDAPSDLEIVHSYYWMSDHFTTEYIYYFEVKPTEQWKEKFLKEHNLLRIDPKFARLSNFNEGRRPIWFLPGTVDNYEVWDTKGYFGSVFINKANGHMFFFKCLV